jgi:predicted metal-dependent phosphoesterase TrpH
VTVLAVTDHDTVDGCDAAETACGRAGIAFVPGIEITAVHGAADVHVLGYFIDRRAPALTEFLAEQRRQRVDRAHRIIDKLAELGIRLDAEAILRPAAENGGKSVGRPWIARALVAAGHVRNVDEAFDRWLSRGRPAFVPRYGPPPAVVFARVHAAGGVASLAHPALVGHDDWIGTFAGSGLDALEAFHSEHDAADTARYLAMADRCGLAISGGSDYHGDDFHGPSHPGSVSLPREYYERLRAIRQPLT